MIDPAYWMAMALIALKVCWIKLPPGALPYGSLYCFPYQWKLSMCFKKGKKVCFGAISGSLNLVFRSFIEGVCVVHLAPTVMTMSGSIVHPRAMILLMSVWYF